MKSHHIAKPHVGIAVALRPIQPNNAGCPVLLVAPAHKHLEAFEVLDMM